MGGWEEEENREECKWMEVRSQDGEVGRWEEEENRGEGRWMETGLKDGWAFEAWQFLQWTRG